MTQLTDKRVVITGGGSGIGADMAMAFAEAGARVTITGRREVALQAVADQHRQLDFAVVDVTDEAAWWRCSKDWQGRHRYRQRRRRRERAFWQDLV